MHGGFYIRDHPKWTEKHPLGPISFDWMCFECNFMVEDVDCDTPKPMVDHWIKNHAYPRLLAEMGIVSGNGEGI